MIKTTRQNLKDLYFFRGNKKSMSFKSICIISCLLYWRLVTCTNNESKQQAMNFQHVSKSCSYFSSNFIQVLASENIEENIVSSPISAYIILSMLLHGSDGTTKKELESALNLLDGHYFQNELQNLLTSLNETEKAEIEIATAMFVNNHFVLQKEFTNQCKNYFQTSLEKINFENDSESVKIINAWVKMHTKGKISHIINTDDIDSYTQVILLNSVYFKSNWFDPFEPEFTKNTKFHNIDGTEVYIPTMKKTFNIPHGYIQSLNANFIKIKYLNKDFEMIIILPDKIYGLKDIVNNFNWDLIKEATYSTKEVELLLPKFQFETTINLKNTLNKMGVELMFEQKANFSHIAQEPSHVNQILQKLFIEINEKGTEATVTTAAQMRTRRMVMDYHNFIVDHPFLFIIQHKPSSTPLFIGNIMKLGETLVKDEL